MRLSSRVKFADEKVKDAFYSLETSGFEAKKLYRFLVQALKNLEEDAFCGTQIPKRLIPKEYLVKYGIDNCWKYNLPGAWRLIYAVERNEVLVLSIILEWLDHKSYERKFKY